MKKNAWNERLYFAGGISRVTLVAMACLLACGAVHAESKDIVQNGGKMLYDYAPANKDTNIAIGPGATAFQGKGGQEVMLSVGRPFTDESFLRFTKYSLKDSPDTRAALPASIAVGGGTYARTGSIDIGSKQLPKAVKIGDVTVGEIVGIQGDASTQDRRLGVVSTTVGTNSYTDGAFATTLGGYNVQTSNYDANGRTSPGLAKNAFATVVGALNSNESYSTKNEASGLANAIVGAVNKVSGSNGAIVIGAGNTVAHSIEYFPDTALNGHYDNVTDMQDALMGAIRRNVGGAVLVQGGANTADYASHSQLTGVRNTLKGEEGKIAKFNYLDGYKNAAEEVTHVSAIGSENNIKKSGTVQMFGDENTAVNVDHVSAIGSGNEIKLAKVVQIFGDNRMIVGKVVEGQVADGQELTDDNSVKNVVAIGSVDENSKESYAIKVSDAVAIGHNTQVTQEGGVALGSQSTAFVKEGQRGWCAPQSLGEVNFDSPVWTSKLAAVSVGHLVLTQDGKVDVEKSLTRQITGVAAGTEDTDAVNVAQLRAALEGLSGGGDAKHTTVEAASEPASGGSSPAGGTQATPPAFTTDGYIKVSPGPDGSKPGNYKVRLNDEARDAIKSVKEIRENQVTVNNRLNRMERHVDRVDHHARAGIASAMAVGTLPQAYQAGDNLIAGSMATYRSASALAFGFSSISDDGSRIYRVNASANTEGDAGFAAGIGFKW